MILLKIKLIRRVFIFLMISILIFNLEYTYVYAQNGNDQAPVAKPIGWGPYRVGDINVEIPRPPKVQPIPSIICYPADINCPSAPANRSEAPYPTLTIAPGYLSKRFGWLGHAQQIASWGFVVVIAEFDSGILADTQNMPAEHSDVLNFLELQNSTQGSRLYGMIDIGKFGCMGHSMGGAACIGAAAIEPRFKACCTLGAATGNGTQDVHIPIQIMVGSNDTTATPNATAYPLYELAHPPKSVITITNGQHSGPYPKEYIVSFFKYWLLNDNRYFTFIYGEEAQRDVANGTIQLRVDLGQSYVKNRPPIATATASPTSGFAPLEVTFTGNGYDPDGRIIRYSWTFGDGSTSSEQNPVHTYTQSGTYSVELTVTDNNYTTASDTLTITVQSTTQHAPVINSVITTPSETVPSGTSTIRVDAYDEDGDTLIYGYTPSGGTISGEGSTVTWNAPNIEGTYTIEVIVNDGHLDSEPKLVNILVTSNPSPVPVNHAPQILSAKSDLASVPNDGKTRVNFIVKITDPDGLKDLSKVTIDLSTIEGKKEQTMQVTTKYGANSTDTKTYSYETVIPPSVVRGKKTLKVTVYDNSENTDTREITIEVIEAAASDSGNDKTVDTGIPGFETPLLLIGLVIILSFMGFKRKIT